MAAPEEEINKKENVTNSFEFCFCGVKNFYFHFRKVPPEGKAFPGNSGSYKVKPRYNLREKGNFGGLFNQGATCYLDALLQSLFMCPEFRDVLMKWTFVPGEHGTETYCIP